MLELLDAAIKAGHQARYVLFDTWFANPHQIVAIKDMNLDTIAMVKKSSSITYEFESRRMHSKQIFPSLHDDPCGGDVPDSEDCVPIHRRTV